METFDVVVIGAGPGGYPAAIRAAQLGGKVAIVERECYGGTCLNWGCIPTKTLIASSTLFRRMKDAGELGLAVEKVSFNYTLMAKRKDEVVGKLNAGVEMLLKANGVRMFKGTASFVDRKKVSVSGEAGSTVLEAKNIIIASGSTSVVPGFIPKGERVVESRKFLELKEMPSSLIVLGGGVIGCEFACMAAQLGVKVTIAEMLSDVLFMLDTDVRREVRSYMEKTLGITIMTGKPMENIKTDGKGVSGVVDGKTIKADMLLVSIGRKPVTDGLMLEKAGLAVTKSGHIEIDRYCQTKISSIFAIGDVSAGSTQLAHAATAQGIGAAENALSRKMMPVETTIPACIFTEPEIGSVGLTEQKAKDLGVNVKIGKFSFAALGKALASGESRGFVKWVVDASTDQLLGAHAVGAHATELISEAATAIRAELTAAEIGRTVHCHPTFSESWMEAAHAAHGACIHAAPKRK